MVFAYEVSRHRCNIESEFLAMHFQIKKLILWPRSEAFNYQEIVFSTGAVNVITGSSKTGKSAIIPIIDYCLGSEKCAIPVNTIRDACSWFGVVFDCGGYELLLARREPGEQKSTGDMFMLQDDVVTVPSRIEKKNTTVDGVKRHLDFMSGLTNLDFDTEMLGIGFKGRPSFRDLMAFCMQPQNIVANPDVFFYKADTYEHKEKLKTILPYILGAVTSSTLEKQVELTQLKKVHKRKSAELNSLRAMAADWEAEIDVQLMHARELGLVKKRLDEGTSLDVKISALRLVVEQGDSTRDLTTSAISEVLQEIAQLQEKESQISGKISSLRTRIIEMTKLRDAVRQYNGALLIQRNRLKVADWLEELGGNSPDCPMCGSIYKGSEANASLSQLASSLHEIEANSIGYQIAPTSIEREYARVTSELEDYVEKFRTVQMQRKTLEAKSNDARRWHQDFASMSRFVGSLEKAIEVYDRVRSDEDLEADVQQLSVKIQELEYEVDKRSIDRALNQAIDRISFEASKIIPGLDVENSGSLARISVADLNVKVEGNGRDDYLWEIGSGSNWVSYHLAMTLALQTFFLGKVNSSVPSFLIYDQPSQAYFPKRLDEGEDASYRDADVDAVVKIFTTLANVVGQHQGKLQVIVLDHAPESIWGNRPHVVKVDEWRGRRKLVPLEWLERVE